MAYNRTRHYIKRWKRRTAYYLSKANLTIQKIVRVLQLNRKEKLWRPLENQRRRLERLTRRIIRELHSWK